MPEDAGEDVCIVLVWGETLMNLHIGYAEAAPFALVRTDTPDKKVRAAGQSPKTALTADMAAGRILIDSETSLSGIPPEAWTYMLGPRCAIAWVLDQHKERKTKDSTINERFNTYRFADHKESVIELLAKVTTVSIETMRILSDMESAPR